VASGHRILIGNERSLVARAARTRQAVIVNDVTQVEDFQPNPMLPRTRAEMALPLIVGEQVIGVLDVQSDVVGKFTEQDVAVQTTLATQVAAAVQNARLFAAGQQRAVEMQTVAEVGAQAVASLDLDRLLKDVVDLTKERFGLYPRPHLPAGRSRGKPGIDRRGWERRRPVGGSRTPDSHWQRAQSGGTCGSYSSGGHRQRRDPGSRFPANPC